MAIYRINGMARLPQSKDPKDRAIFCFAQKSGIRSLSYRDYKYLYCLLSVESISRAIGGHPMHRREQAMRIWLDIANAEKKIELTGKALCPNGVPDDVFKELKPLLEAEVRSPDMSYLVKIREKLGETVSKLFVCSVNGEAQADFWRKITTTMFLLDTLADAFQDRRNGIVKKLNISGFFLLAEKLAKNSLSVILQIGILKSLKLLFAPSIMTINGGFESDAKKEKQWLLAPEPNINLENKPKTSIYPAPLSRI